MRKYLLLLALIVLSGKQASAEPHRFDKKFWTLAAVTVASSFAANYTAHRCETRFGRDHGCFGGGYASDRLKNGLRIGFSTGMVALAFAAKRDQAGAGVWATFQAVPLTWNTVTITQNLRHKGCPISICKDTD